MAAELTIDYTPISTWAFTLVDTQGEQDGPMIKHPYMQNWNDRHGIDIDLDTTYLEPLEMQLVFLIKTSTFTSYRNKLNAFKTQMRRAGLHVIKYPNVGDLPYFAFVSDTIRVERILGYGGAAFAARVYVSLTVPYPLGRYFYITQSSVSMRITCSTPILVDWGNGTSQFVEGTNVVVSKVLSSFSYVALLGNIEDISSITNITGLVEIVEG